MKRNKYRHIIIFFCIVTIISCRSKKEAECPAFDIEEDLENKEEKKRSKYKIVILKDGTEIGKGSKKRKRKKVKLF